MNALARFGVIATICGVVVSVLTYLNVRPRKSWLLLLAGFAGGVVVASLVFGVFDLLRPPPPAPEKAVITPGPSPSGDAVELKITNPKGQVPREHVSQQTTVFGTVKGRRSDEMIWLFTRGMDEKATHPQQAPAATANENWNCRIVVGGEGDAGREFRIIAAVVDAKEAQTIRTYLDQASQSGEATDYAPHSVHPTHTVIVKRD